jgi:hypothetical protein
MIDLTVFMANAAIIVPAIITVTKLFTDLIDKNGKFYRYYPAIPIVLGMVASILLANPFTWQTVGLGIIVYGLAPGEAYKLTKTTVLGN